MSIDIFGSIKSVGPISSVQQRDASKQYSIVRLLICDDTDQIEVSLWNEQVLRVAKNFQL